MKSPFSLRSDYPRHQYISSSWENIVQNRERPFESGRISRPDCKIRIEFDELMINERFSDIRSWVYKHVTKHENNSSYIHVDVLVHLIQKEKT